MRPNPGGLAGLISGHGLVCSGEALPVLSRQQGRQVSLYPLSECLHVVDGDVPLSPLDRPDIGSVQSNKVCKGLLGKAKGRPCCTQVSCEHQSCRFETSIPGFGHGKRMVAMMTMTLQTISSFSLDRCRETKLGQIKDHPVISQIRAR